jgi:hypothetical protein
MHMILNMFDGFPGSQINEKTSVAGSKSQAFLSAVETRRTYYGLEPTLPEGLTEQKVIE